MHVEVVPAHAHGGQTLGFAVGDERRQPRSASWRTTRTSGCARASRARWRSRRSTRTRPALRSPTVTSRSGSAYGSGRSSTASTTVKIAVLAPMPSASVRSAASGEARRASQHADAVARVLPERVEERQAALIAPGLGDLRLAAELEPRRAAGRGRVEPAGAVALFEHLAVEGELGRQVARPAGRSPMAPPARASNSRSVMAARSRRRARAP